MAADRIIQGEFDGYVKSVYCGLTPGCNQYEHLRGAFFGGATIALGRGPKEVIRMQDELLRFGNSAPIATRPLEMRSLVVPLDPEAYMFWLGDPGRGVN